LAAVAAALIALVAVAVGVAVTRGSGDEQQAPAAGGLPETSDYHSLLVSPTNPNELVLGTHQGLYRSTDSGRSWEFAGLGGKDAMNLAQPAGSTVWTAGHNVLAKSTDGGRAWADVRPDGLPGLDVHGFAVDPKKPNVLYGAVANQGLYRSTDGGGSFALVSREVGPAVMALAITRDGRILAGDMQQGLLESADGGRRWTARLRAGVMGIAINPRDPQRLLATEKGIFLSRDGGRSWEQMLSFPEGMGPVAWSPRQRNVAYVVGYTRTLYKTSDGGESWQPVG
jgi:photosystem II stability/assembly factor-like uncharacterized protein